MKSPFTGKEMLLVVKEQTIIFKTVEVTIQHHSYVCADTDESFTTEELDQINYTQLKNEYRERFKIPFTEEIVELRKRYDVSLANMNAILGFGANMYSKYEKGEIPSVSSAKLITLVRTPRRFMELVNDCSSIDPKVRTKLIKKVESLISKDSAIACNKHMWKILGGQHTSSMTGYREFNMDRMEGMIVFFSEKVKPTITKLNKLLFYSDFGHFKKTCRSISGSPYRAIQHGPVPIRYGTLFEWASLDQNAILKTSECKEDGWCVESFVASKSFDSYVAHFDPSEVVTMNEVLLKLGSKSASEIRALSHIEDAWVQNQKEREVIDYPLAFNLKNI